MPQPNEAMQLDSKIYQLWFEFLRESDRKKWSLEVERRFGDVWNIDFDKWWLTHKYLFEKISPFTIKEILSVEEFEDYFSDSDSSPVFVINIHSTRLEIKNELDRILDERNKNKRGRPVFEDLAEYHNLTGPVSVGSLQTTLKVYRKCKDHPGLTPVEIENELGLLNKTGRHAHNYWKAPSSPTILKSRIKIQKMEVARQLKRAAEIIANVENGTFP